MALYIGSCMRRYSPWHPGMYEHAFLHVRSRETPSSAMNNNGTRLITVIHTYQYIIGRFFFLHHLSLFEHATPTQFFFGSTTILSHSSSNSASSSSSSNHPSVPLPQAQLPAATVGWPPAAGASTACPLRLPAPPPPVPSVTRPPQLHVPPPDKKIN